MRIVITGGHGFLGRAVATELLERGTFAGTAIDQLILADIAEPGQPAYADPSVSTVTGELTATLPQIFADPVDVVIHLAAAVSGECEADFDLGMRLNIALTQSVLEACRTQHESGGPLARMFFASSVAVYGADAALPLPDVITEATITQPQSSYGAQKVICEQLVADYTRKGFVDGRVARIMTVSVRPGAPNAAASGFLSGIIREPLNGVQSTCPVELTQRVALSSPRRAVDGILVVTEAERGSGPGELCGRLPVNLPALSVTVEEILQGLHRVGGSSASSLVQLTRDERVAEIVASWPSRFDNTRSAALGLHRDDSIDAIIRQYVTDHLS